MAREYDYGKKLGYLPTLDKLPIGCKSLIGWFNGNSQASETTDVRYSITYHAKYQRVKVDEYTVKFYKDDGTTELTELRKENVLSGSILGTLSTNPYSKEGYSFIGWYTKSEGSTKVDETKVVTNNLNLYAQWGIATYTITWNPNYDGAASLQTWSKTYNTELGTLPM